MGENITNDILKSKKQNNLKLFTKLMIKIYIEILPEGMDISIIYVENEFLKCIFGGNEINILLPTFFELYFVLFK